MKAGLSSGFTILEVMIFLAITSLIFVSAIVSIGGRQESTQYTQGIRELDTTIQTVVNDVTNGYYPQTSLHCRAVGGVLTFNAIGSDQGSNQGCIFLGKALHFAEAGTDREGLVVYTLAGLQKQLPPNQHLDVTNLQQANPTVVPEFTQRLTTTYGLKITRVIRRGGTLAEQTPFIAFLSSLGRINPADQSMGSNARTARLAAIFSGTSINASSGSVIADLESLSDTAPNHIQQASDGLVVCVESVNGNFQGAIGIGLQGGGLTTTVDQDIRASQGYPECTA